MLRTELVWIGIVVLGGLLLSGCSSSTARARAQRSGDSSPAQMLTPRKLPVPAGREVPYGPAMYLWVTDLKEYSAIWTELV